MKNQQHAWPLSIRVFLAATCLASIGAVIALPTARAADKEKDQTIAIADGKIKLTAPDKWERKQPKSRIIEHEFSVPAAEGDAEPGRVTVMGAGGSVDANLDRWASQFSQPEGGESKEKLKKEKKTIAGEEVYLIDLSGTYRDSMGAGPFSPNSKIVERPDYRMLAAVIVDPKEGNYFIKFYGPKKTVAENQKAFDAMIEGLKAK